MTHPASESLPPAGAHALTSIQWVLIALPAAFAAWMVAQYGVDVPFWEEWTIAGFLQNVDDGVLTWSALVGQHNEHRMMVPRIVQLAVALTVGWDTRILMWLSQGLVLATLTGCVLLWRRSLEHRTAWPPTLSLALASLLLFSPAQHQNVLWGFQICFYIPAACLLASTIVTFSPRARPGLSLAAAAVLSTIATFSILPGLLTWPLTALAVRFRFGPLSRATAWKWCLWAAWATAVVGFYFFRYQAPEHSPSWVAALQDPLALLTGIAVCVGNPFGVGTQPVRFAVATGVLATGALGWLMLSIWRRRSDPQLVVRAAPWIVLSSFGFLSGVAIAIGRLGYGYVALLESRYATLTVWLYIGLVMLAAVLRDRAATAFASRQWALASGSYRGFLRSQPSPSSRADARGVS